jgi:hypothetical protein
VFADVVAPTSGNSMRRPAQACREWNFVEVVS